MDCVGRCFDINVAPLSDSPQKSSPNPISEHLSRVFFPLACRYREAMIGQESRLLAMDGQWILAQGNRPFTDPDAAACKAELLGREVGERFEVVTHPQGGYAVQLAQHGAGRAAVKQKAPRVGRVNASAAGEGGLREPPSRVAGPSEPVATSPMAPAETPAAPAHLRIRPAPRAFLLMHVMALLGVVLTLFPQTVLMILPTALSADLDTGLVAGLLGVTMLGGLSMALYYFGKFLWIYAANRYAVTADAVEMAYGIIARKTARVSIAHIRTIDVEQSLLQRLLRVGTVKLATAGTQEFDLILRHVATPVALQLEIQRRYRLLDEWARD